MDMGRAYRRPADLFLPGWVWFSIPLIPIHSNASTVLGFNANNVVYGWDDAGKTFLLCPMTSRI